jgi:L-lactate dehydrogenase
MLVDVNPARAQAQADDIQHAVPFANPLDVRAGSYADLADSQVVVIAAGVNRGPGESRLQLLQRNAAIFREMVPQILEHAADAILVVATNPVDIMTHLTARFAVERGTLSTRVIGSGTTLDTARFRALLGRHLGVDSPHVHAYVIGEHGDSEVFPWSLVTVGGMSLSEYCAICGMSCDEDVRKDVEERVRFAGRSIIAGKGATYYGIGTALARIVEVVLKDQRSILTVCTPHPEVAGVSDVTVSFPHLVGGNGILARLPLNLNEAETAALHASTQIVRESIDSLG